MITKWKNRAKWIGSETNTGKSVRLPILLFILQLRSPLVAFYRPGWCETIVILKMAEREETTMNLQHLRITLYNNGNNSISRCAQHTVRGLILTDCAVHRAVISVCALRWYKSNALLIRFIHKVCFTEWNKLLILRIMALQTRKSMTKPLRNRSENETERDRAKNTKIAWHKYKWKKTRTHRYIYK